MLWTNEILWDLNLRWVSDGYPILHIAQHLKCGHHRARWRHSTWTTRTCKISQFFLFVCLFVFCCFLFFVFCFVFFLVFLCFCVVVVFFFVFFLGGGTDQLIWFIPRLFYNYKVLYDMICWVRVQNKNIMSYVFNIYTLFDNGNIARSIKNGYIDTLCIRNSLVNWLISVIRSV